MFLSVAAILAESAARRPEHPAVVFDDGALSYAALWEGARRVAAVLRQHGVARGDAVALMLPNTPHFPTVYYAVLALGAVAVPVPAPSRVDETVHILTDSGATALVCAGPLLAEGARAAERAGVRLFTVMSDHGPVTPAPRLDELTAATEPISRYEPTASDDVAVILYTSGTTGTPKGVALTHLNIVMNVDVVVLSAFDIGPDDVVLGCLPLFHSFGQTCAMNTAFRVGATLVLMPRFAGPDALDLLVTHDCSVFMGFPTMYIALLEAARGSDRRPMLNAAVSGGAALPLAVLEEFQALFGCPVYEGYGLTETSPVAAFNQRDWPCRAGTVGRPVWGVDVEIARADVRDRIEPLPAGDLGEVVIRGHNVMAGYHNNPDATAEAVVDGWFRSGDLGRQDADGYLSLVGRMGDVVVRDGHAVYPREVEEVLLRHPDVAEVAVIGLPDAAVGQEVCAVVVSEVGATPDAGAVLGWARSRLAPHAYPRRVEFVEALPVGASGKVLTRELVARFSG